jgi:hypothetical protein
MLVATGSAKMRNKTSVRLTDYLKIPRALASGIMARTSGVNTLSVSHASVTVRVRKLLKRGWERIWSSAGVATSNESDLYSTILIVRKLLEDAAERSLFRDVGGNSSNILIEKCRRSVQY